MCAVQAADTVKTQAVQLASSRSQVASATAAQKAADQVSAMLCTNALICCKAFVRFAYALSRTIVLSCMYRPGGA